MIQSNHPPSPRVFDCCVPACDNGNPNSPRNSDRCACCYEQDEGFEPLVSTDPTGFFLFGTVILIILYMYLKNEYFPRRKRRKDNK